MKNSKIELQNQVVATKNIFSDFFFLKQVPSVCNMHVILISLGTVYCIVCCLRYHSFFNILFIFLSGAKFQNTWEPAESFPGYLDDKNEEPKKD